MRTTYRPQLSANAYPFVGMSVFYKDAQIWFSPTSTPRGAYPGTSCSTRRMPR